jgi:hypothetical protein
MPLRSSATSPEHLRLIQRWGAYYKRAGVGHDKTFTLARKRARQQLRGNLPRGLVPV